MVQRDGSAAALVGTDDGCVDLLPKKGLNEVTNYCIMIYYTAD